MDFDPKHESESTPQWVLSEKKKSPSGVT